MFYFLLAMPGGEGAGALPNSSADTSNVRGALFALPPPPPLDIHDSNAAEKWKEFEQAWKNYSIAMKLHQEPEAVQVATLLTVIGAEARTVFATFTGIGRATPTKTRFSLCYKSLQHTVSHLKMCLLKDISFILECKNRESLTITIRKLFDS